MKTKLIDSGYFPKTGVSSAVIKTKYGLFAGVSSLREEDKEVESSFRGCQYAEIKAIRKAYKAEIKELNLKIKTLQDFEKVLKNMKEYNEHSFEAKRLRKEIFLYQKKKKEIQETIADITQTLLKGMEEYPSQVEKLRKKRESKYNKVIE